MKAHVLLVLSVYLIPAGMLASACSSPPPAPAPDAGAEACAPLPAGCPSCSQVLSGAAMPADICYQNPALPAACAPWEPLVACSEAKCAACSMQLVQPRPAACDTCLASACAPELAACKER